jgi:hypothetical protein
MKKPRSDSKLANLPEEDQAEIAEWCRTNPLEVVRDILLAQRKVSISLSSLSTWYAWHKQQRELREGNAGVVAILDWFKRNDPGASAATVRSAMLMGLTLKAQARDDTGLALNVLKEQGRDLDRGLAMRRVALLEENAAKAKAALEGLKSKGGLTAETLRTIEEAAGLL